MGMYSEQMIGMRKMNQKIKCVLVLVILACSIGCNRYVHIHDRYPVYKTPEKTTLPKLTSEKLAPLDDTTEKQVIKAVRNHFPEYEANERVDVTEAEIMTALKKEYDLGFGECALIAADYGFFFKPVKRKEQ